MTLSRQEKRFALRLLKREDDKIKKISDKVKNGRMTPEQAMTVWKSYFDKKIIIDENKR